jgi:hypothetical protein
MSRLTALAAVLFVSLVASAPGAPIPKHLMRKDPVYYPTKVGTKLVYAGDGIEITKVVTKVEKVDEGTMASTDILTSDGNAIPDSKVLVTPKGLYITERGEVAYDPPWCILRLPHNVGDCWDSVSTRPGGVSIEARMMAGKAERITIPAGEFTAARVDWAIPSDKMNPVATCWFVEGMGLVRFDFVGKSSVLKSFTPGKD